jgi:hypothetical protein
VRDSLESHVPLARLKEPARVLELYICKSKYKAASFGWLVLDQDDGKVFKDTRDATDRWKIKCSTMVSSIFFAMLADSGAPYTSSPMGIYLARGEASNEGRYRRLGFGQFWHCPGPFVVSHEDEEIEII